MPKQHHKSERHHALDTNYPHKPQRMWEQPAPQRTPQGPSFLHWALLAASIAGTLAVTVWL